MPCCAPRARPHMGDRSHGLPLLEEASGRLGLGSSSGSVALGVPCWWDQRCRDCSCGVQSEHAGLKGHCKSQGTPVPLPQNNFSNFRQDSRPSFPLEALWQPWGRISSTVAGPVPGCSRMHWSPSLLLGGWSSAGGREGPPTNCLFFQGAAGCPGPWGFVSLPAQLPAQLLCFAG